MSERKYCVTCKKPLIAWMGRYMHPSKPCSGLTDYIDVEGTVQDKFLYDKFIKMYGTPTINDYDYVTILLKHKELLIKKIDKDRLSMLAYEKVLHIWIVRLAVKVYEFLNRR